MKRLVDIVKGFEKKKVLVLGDVMLDKYVFGDALRISPEAPIPVVKVNERRYLAGGAGNTAANVTSLGGHAYIVSVVGDDIHGRNLIDVLKHRNINTSGIVISHLRPTTVKERIVAQSQQVVRVDEEVDDYIESHFEEKVVEKIGKLLPRCEAVVVSDYAKGVVTQNVMDGLNSYSRRKIPVVIDPKPKNKLFYKGCEVITPNVSEAKAMVMEGYSDLTHLCSKLRDQLDCNVLLTLGEHGMKLIDKKGFEYNFDAITKGVHDVTGAGDTAVAVLAMSLAAGASHNQAAQLANYAAGIVVRKFGAATVSKEELVKIINEYKT